MVANIKRLAFFESWIDRAAERILAGRPDIELVRLSYAASEEDNRDALARAHGYQISPRGDLHGPYFGDRDLIARCPQLLAISSTGAGYDMVDVAACTEAGIIVVNQTGTNTEAVAEHVLGMMLVLSKRMIQADRALRGGGDAPDRYAFKGNDIRGKTIGIIGLGNIGSRLAALCRGLFQMRVIAYDPYLTPEQFRERGGESVGLATLLAEADFVSVNCPRSDETLGMIDAQAFARMKPGAYFITTARGGIHDEAALAAALAERRIAGAGLDVWRREPPPRDHPLLGFENVIATPHNAGITDEALRGMAVGAAEQWMTIFDGRRPPRLVNPQAWPAYAARFERILGLPVER